MRSRLFAGIVWAIVGIPAIAVAQPDERLKAALVVAEKLVADSPNDAKTHLQLGGVRLAMRENEAAVKAFTRAIELDPKMTEAFDRRGDAYLKLGKFTEAVADYDAFLKVNPKFGPQHWRRGIALYYAGKFEDGVK